MQRFTLDGYEFKLNKDMKRYYGILLKKRMAWRSDYNAIAKWIDKNIDGGSYGDIGCGNGHMIAYLHGLGKKVWGVDAVEGFEQYVDKEVRQYVKRADLTKLHGLEKCDIALCFEVAERIEEKYADLLIENIASTGASTILFTAAQPEKAGIVHINLQPRKYWLDKFSKFRYCLDAVLTEKFKDNLAKNIKNPIWYLDDIMILQKCDNGKTVRAYEQAYNYIEDIKMKVEDLTLKNKMLKHMEQAYWSQNQHLNSILSSRRWIASTKLMRLIKK